MSDDLVPSIDIDAAARFLESEAGLVFDEGRRTGLQAVLERRLVVTGTPDVATYLHWVSMPDGAQERQVLLDAVTIQETYFFRNGPQMAALRQHVLPDLIRGAAAQRRPLRIWSAGCSTGEEPYTLAMLVLETMERLGMFVDTHIIGTDISAAAIDHGRAATYRGRTLEMAEPDARDRWFVDAGHGYRIVDPDVRAMVDLRVHNLVSDPPPFDPGTVDLLVCRNVTIYFAKPTTGRIIERFHDVLVPQGHLLLGHAETLWQVSDDFDLFPLGEAFVYRKADLVARARLADQVRKQRPPVVAPTRKGPRAAQRRASTRHRAPTVVRIPAPVRVPDASEMLLAAQAALDEGRYVEALDHARAAIRRDSLRADSYAIAGRAAVALGDDASALEPLRKGVFLQPGCAEAHFTLAGVLDRMGQHRAAAASYRAAGAAVITTDAGRLQRMLDGRDPASLAALCEQLAESAEHSAALSIAGGQ